MWLYEFLREFRRAFYTRLPPHFNDVVNWLVENYPEKSVALWKLNVRYDVDAQVLDLIEEQLFKRSSPTIASLWIESRYCVVDKNEADNILVARRPWFTENQAIMQAVRSQKSNTPSPVIAVQVASGKLLSNSMDIAGKRKAALSPIAAFHPDSEFLEKTFNTGDVVKIAQFKFLGNNPAVPAKLKKLTDKSVANNNRDLMSNASWVTSDTLGSPDVMVQKLVTNNRALFDLVDSLGPVLNVAADWLSKVSALCLQNDAPVDALDVLPLKYIEKGLSYPHINETLTRMMMILWNNHLENPSFLHVLHTLGDSCAMMSFNECVNVVTQAAK